MPAAIRFHFDLLSPYAYVAWRALPPIAARHGRAIEATPVLFAAILDHHGQKGPAEIPAKRAYALKDAYRKAAALGVLPIAPPPSHPFSPLLALRVAGLVPLEDRGRAVDALFDAVWAGGGGVETEETVRAVLDAANLEGASLVESSREPSAKQILRDATSRAIAEGVFGVPTMLVDGELFFGVDSLPHLDRFLSGDDAVPEDLVARWATLPSTATRPGSKDSG